MICHVCQEQAVGQCKECLKFYCARHGDGVCVRCAEAIAPRPAPRELDLRLPEYRGGHQAPVAAGPHCYKCGATAVGACAKCGQFYCGTHRGGSSFFDNTRGSWFQEGRILCEDCLSGANMGGMIGCMFGVIVLVVMGIIFLAMAAR